MSTLLTSFLVIKKNSLETQLGTSWNHSGICPPMCRKAVTFGGARDHGMLNNVAHTRALGAITPV
jgi:hypothetical protein